MLSNSPFLGPIVRIRGLLHNSNRNQLVDVLRGMAILMVLLGHYPTLDRFWAGSPATWFGRGLSDIRAGMSYYGVVIFFVISGFLITSITLRRYQTPNKINFSEFWWFRFSRIMPMILLCLFAMGLLHFFWIAQFHFYEAKVLWKTVTAVLSFRFYDAMGATTPFAAWNPLWSLSVEEMFYLIFPFACLVINGLGAAGWLTLVVVSSALYMRYSGQASPYSLLGFMDLLGLGCFLAILRSERLTQWLTARQTTIVGTVAGAAGMILITFCVVSRHPINEPEWSALACGFGAMLVIFSSQVLGAPSGIFSTLLAPMSLLGVVSYELYLVHMPLAVIADDTIAFESWLLVLVALLLAVFTHAYFSEPMNRTLRQLAAIGRDGASAELRLRMPLLRRGLLLPIIPLLCVVLIGWAKAKSQEASVAIFRIDSLADMPADTSEPLVYSGKAGAAQLVYLKHDGNGVLRVGIDQWAVGGYISGPLAERDLSGGEFRVLFSIEGVYVYYQGKFILRSPKRCYEGKIGPLGVNDIGFISATTAASSKIVRAQ